jgi:phosphoglycerate kinase
MPFRTLDDAGEIYEQRALVRVDFNVPMDGGRVTDDTRLRAALPTIRRLRDMQAKVILLAHFERPKGKRVPEMSLRQIIPALSEVVGSPVAFAEDCVGPAAKSAIAQMGRADVLLLENVRFHAGEETNDDSFVSELAELGDLYVNDAFSAAHRAHASTEGLARRLPAYAGEGLKRELEMLDKALGEPERPVIGIVGGSKVSTKLDLLNNLVTRLDRLAIGGGMANTFLARQGHDVGARLCEHDLARPRAPSWRRAQLGCELLLPVDVVVSDKVEPGRPRPVRRWSEVQATTASWTPAPRRLKRLKSAIDGRRHADLERARSACSRSRPSTRRPSGGGVRGPHGPRDGRLTASAGGGDTVAALNHAGVGDDFTFVSTAGGAFLEWMEGKTLPGVAALQVEDR